MSLYRYETAQGSGLSHDPVKAIVAPRPIGWISTRSADGVDNLAPYSFFSQFSDGPAIIGFCSMTRKDSLANIEATGEFVYNLASRPLAEAMNLSSGDYPPDVDEFAQAGLEKRASMLVAPAQVADSPAALECRVTQIVRLRDLAGADLARWLVLGQVVAVTLDERCLVDGLFDTARAEPLLRAGYAADYWAIGDAGRFAMRRPG